MLGVNRRVSWAILLSVLSAFGMATRGASTELPLISLIASLEHRGKNTMTTMPRDSEADQAFIRMLEAFVAGDEASAMVAVPLAGYEVKRISQTGRQYTVLVDAADAIGPTIVLASAPQRDLIFEAPHGVADRATDIQSALGLTRLGARALILAGAHRCAASSSSVCSGKTRICGDGRERYRTSDVAHNVGTRFHMAHTILARAWPKATVVQLHGFGAKGSDSWVVISDTSKESRPGDTAFTGKVRDGIRDWFGKPERAVSCQDPEDKRFDYRTLCARTNVQGRDLNGSPDVCLKSSDTATGRFLHVEQSWEIRREARDHWAEIDDHPMGVVVIDAIGKALPCTLAACR